MTIVERLLNERTKNGKCEVIKAEQRRVVAQIDRLYWAAERCGLDDDLCNRITMLEQENANLAHMLRLHSGG